MDRKIYTRESQKMKISANFIKLHQVQTYSNIQIQQDDIEFRPANDDTVLKHDAPFKRNWLPSSQSSTTTTTPTTTKSESPSCCVLPFFFFALLLEPVKIVKRDVTRGSYKGCAALYNDTSGAKLKTSTKISWRKSFYNESFGIIWNHLRSLGWIKTKRKLL